MSISECDLVRHAKETNNRDYQITTTTTTNTITTLVVIF